MTNNTRLRRKHNQNPLHPRRIHLLLRNPLRRNRSHLLKLQHRPPPRRFPGRPHVHRQPHAERRDPGHHGAGPGACGEDECREGEWEYWGAGGAV